MNLRKTLASLLAVAILATSVSASAFASDAATATTTYVCSHKPCRFAF